MRSFRSPAARMVNEFYKKGCQEKSSPSTGSEISFSKPAKVKVRAETRFTERRETLQDRSWVGINLRAQLFYANLGHLNPLAI